MWLEIIANMNVAREGSFKGEFIKTVFTYRVDSSRKWCSVKLLRKSRVDKYVYKAGRKL